MVEKLFVLVPAGTSVTLDNLKTESRGNKKIYFVEDLNQIVHNGITYGVDPKSSKEITSLIDAIGGSVAADGTVTVDFSSTNYAKASNNIVAAIVALDAKIKGELDKLANSKTLNDNYEFTGSIKYVAAVPASEGKDAIPAHIALVDEDDTELSTIAVSNIIGNGVLKSSTYDAATGILTLTFANADGTETPINVDLKAMLDINDISIAEASKNYLEVTLGTAETEGETQAVFGAKVKKIVGAGESADLTGLADAADVKAYVDSKATDLAVEAAGDEYIIAAVDGSNNKKINVTADVQNVTYTAGTHATYDDKGAKLTEPTAANISGVDKSLVDGKQATAAIKSYIDFVVTEEALRTDANVLASIKGLDKASETIDGTNIHITYKEEDGIVTIESLTADYATVNRTNTTSTAETPASNAAINVVDPSKLVIGSDLEKVAAYAADKVTEEKHRVDKKIEDLAGSATDTDSGNYISVTVTSAHGEVSGVTVEFDPWETYTV